MSLKIFVHALILRILSFSLVACMINWRTASFVRIWLLQCLCSFIESVLPLLKMVGSQLTHLRWLFYFSKFIRISNDIIPHANINLHIAQPWKPEVLRRDPRWPAVSQVDLTQVVQHTLLLQVPSNQSVGPTTVSLFGLYLTCLWLNSRVAEVARSREGASPKTYGSDENFEPLHTF